MEVRDRILEEATKQFFTYGIRNVTMDDIASLLAISKRTVYETFKDKTDLIRSCLKNIKEIQDKKNQSIIASLNVIEAIFTFMQQGIKAINSINPVFFSDLKKLYPSIWGQVHSEHQADAYNLTHRLLRKGINEGLFRKDINLTIVSKLFHEQMNLIADKKIFPLEEFSYTEVFKNLTINFLRGISTNKGIQIIDSLME